jgi:uncharacterized membrane protein HdeD (DUF308 family)
MGIKLYKTWWLLSLKAILIFGFGLIIIIRDNPGFLFITLIAGLMLIAGGLAVLAGSWSQKKYNYEWTWWLLEGLIDVVIGAIIIIRPGESPLVFLILLALWTLISAILLIITAINIHFYISNKSIIYFLSATAFLSGIFFLYSINLDFYAIINLIGFFGLLYGLLLFYFSLQLKDVLIEEIDEIE